MVVGAGQVGLGFQKVLIYWVFHIQPSLWRWLCVKENGQTENGPKKRKISSEQQFSGRKCLIDAKGERRMARLVWDDRKSTVTQMTTRHNQGMQNEQHIKPWNWRLRQHSATLDATFQVRTWNWGSQKLSKRRLEKHIHVHKHIIKLNAMLQQISDSFFKEP